MKIILVVALAIGLLPSCSEPTPSAALDVNTPAPGKGSAGTTAAESSPPAVATPAVSQSDSATATAAKTAKTAKTASPVPAAKPPQTEPSAKTENTEKTEKNTEKTEKNTETPNNPAAPPTREKRLLKASPAFIRAQRALAEARNAARKGETERALTLFEESLEHSPHNLMALAGCFDALRALQRFDEAIAMFQDLPPGLQKKDSLVYQVALTQYEKGEIEQALKTISAVLPPDSRFAAAHYLQARALAALGDEAAAITSLKQAAEHGFFKAKQVESQREFALLQDNAEFRDLVARLRVEQSKKPVVDPKSLAEREEELRPYPEHHPEASPLDIIKELRQNFASGRHMPVNIDLLDLHGKPFRSSAYKGKTLAIVVWASWSLRSHRMLQVMQQLAHDMKDDDVAVIAMAWEIVHEGAQSEPEAARLGALATLKRLNVTLPCALADSRALAPLYINGVPSVAFVTADGIMRTQTRGDYLLNVMKGTIREVKRIGDLAEAARKRGEVQKRQKYGTVVSPEEKPKDKKTTVESIDELNLIRGPAEGKKSEKKNDEAEKGDGKED